MAQYCTAVSKKFPQIVIPQICGLTCSIRGPFSNVAICGFAIFGSNLFCNSWIAVHKLIFLADFKLLNIRRYISFFLTNLGLKCSNSSLYIFFYCGRTNLWTNFRRFRNELAEIWPIEVFHPLWPLVESIGDLRLARTGIPMIFVDLLFADEPYKIYGFWICGLSRLRNLQICVNGMCVRICRCA